MAVEVEEKSAANMEISAVFEEIRDVVRADARGRIVLGAEFSGKNFMVARSANGDLLLTPVAMIPEREVWLYSGSEEAQAFWRGMEQSRNGQVVKGEDFTKYLAEEE